MTYRAVVLTLAILVMSVSQSVHAGNFKVTPIKVYLEEHQKTQTLTLRNESESSVTVQFEAMEWRQNSEGQDAYEQSKAIVIFPKILTVEPNSEKLIRLGYQGPPAGAQERTYRVFMTEIPVAKTAEVGLQMAMRLGVPVFVVPKKGKPVLDIERVTMVKGVAEVHVTNPGNKHVYVKNIEVTGLDVSDKPVFTQELKGWYVLSGTHRMFPVVIPTDSCAAGTKLRVTVAFANQDVEQVPVTTTQPMPLAGCGLSVTPTR
jgi:fimbrial chaperone protein